MADPCIRFAMARLVGQETDHRSFVEFEIGNPSEDFDRPLEDSEIARLAGEVDTFASLGTGLSWAWTRLALNFQNFHVPFADLHWVA